MAKEEGKPDRGVVQYIGASTRRGLTVENFESVGVGNQKSDLWWTRENNWRVPRSEISDDAYERAMKHDPEFILVGGEGEESLSQEQAEGRKGLAADMTPMPPGPEAPGDYVGGGSLTGGSSGGATGAAGATGAKGARGGSASGSTGT